MTAVQYLIDQLQAPCWGIPSHVIEEAERLQKSEYEKMFIAGGKLAFNFKNPSFEEVYKQIQNEGSTS